MSKLWLIGLLLPFWGQAQNWDKSFQFQGAGKFSDQYRSNPYQIAKNQLPGVIQKGMKHAVTYPLSDTELLVPYKLFKRAFDPNARDPLQLILKQILKLAWGLEGQADLFRWLGFHDYPKIKAQNYSHIPYTKEQAQGLPLGTALMTRYNRAGMTFGCAACHTGQLFGKPIVGLTNRFVRANEIYVRMKKLIPLLLPNAMGRVLRLHPGDVKMLQEIKHALQFVAAKTPEHLSLDSSSYQVGMSLAKRQKDAFATRKLNRRVSHPFSKIRPESKPAVWWNLKYKTRWLSDGASVSGNPVIMNFVWNEIGRGADLKKTQAWLKKNSKVVKELTTAVFNTKAPYYLDFFPKHSIDLAQAKRGEVLFKNNCQKCHGQYVKNWSLPQAANMTKYELLKTAQVKYHKKTPVIDVGTDPDRYLAVKYFYQDVNRLAVNQDHQVQLMPQKGYVPPPLVGIWARWPYFHNSSVPSLCDVLSPAGKRPVVFWTGEALDPVRDFDQSCNGYPQAAAVPKSWKQNPHSLYDTRKQGMTNVGHDKRILLKADGREKFSKAQKMDLIAFLKTL